MRQHGLELKQERAPVQVPCICGLRSNQRQAWLMVCEKVTDSQFTEGPGGGLLGHMTPRAPADRLMIWRIAAGSGGGLGVLDAGDVPQGGQRHVI
jgi:hypothetical protein